MFVQGLNIEKSGSIEGESPQGFFNAQNPK